LKLVAAPRHSWRRFVPMAAAAAIVLAVGLAGVDRWRHRDDNEITRGAEGEVALISPVESAAAGSVTFVWHRVPGATQYTLEVDAGDGTVLFTARGADTVQTAPNLVAGEHRWSVRARMDDGSERRSVSRSLRVP
ncbi:MAG TPA: hypothetical protein VM076_15530, partial [Gemmatimonadaceae bacterium]|nr:hypothetical protein [Gemmatimonadaceae bacterium]